MFTHFNNHNHLLQIKVDNELSFCMCVCVSMVGGLSSTVVRLNLQAALHSLEE